MLDPLIIFFFIFSSKPMSLNLSNQPPDPSKPPKPPPDLSPPPGPSRQPRRRPRTPSPSPPAGPSQPRLRPRPPPPPSPSLPPGPSRQPAVGQPEGSPEMVDYAKFKIPELKEKCRELGLRVGGVKKVLIARLQSYRPLPERVPNEREYWNEDVAGWSRK